MLRFPRYDTSEQKTETASVVQSTKRIESDNQTKECADSHFADSAISATLGAKRAVLRHDSNRFPAIARIHQERRPAAGNRPFASYRQPLDVHSPHPVPTNWARASTSSMSCQRAQAVAAKRKPPALPSAVMWVAPPSAGRTRPVRAAPGRRCAPTPAL